MKVLKPGKGVEVTKIVDFEHECGRCKAMLLVQTEDVEMDFSAQFAGVNNYRFNCPECGWTQFKNTEQVQTYKETVFVKRCTITHKCQG